MNEKRNYHVIIGSKSYFDSIVNNIEGAEDAGFLELVRQLDSTKHFYGLSQETDEKMQEKLKKPLLIIKNDNYHGIVETAHDRLGGLIEDLTLENAIIYIHNPPLHLLEYLDDKYRRNIINLDTIKEDYKIKRDPNSFVESINVIREKILGQDYAINEVSKSLWYLTSVNRKKPYVIMLYGNSSLGKTELVREVANQFFDGRYLEKHLSMFKNNNYSDYFFGDSPNRRSIGFDLLERDSNLIFLDEIDKCPEYFYSAFYTLFDNVLFKDATYEVDISGTIIILTSNYKNEEEMKTNLGLPVFYRIDKYIHFSDFSTEIIYDIVQKEIQSRQDEYRDKLSIEDIYKTVSPKLNATGENARTIKYKIQQVIEDLLFAEIEEETH